MEETEKIEVTPGIRSGVKILENSVDDIKITIIDDYMERSEPSEKYPEGLLGATVEVEKNEVKKVVFLTPSFCEDMHSKHGDEIAIKFINSVFKEENSDDKEI
jgi:hypothetical protein